MNGGRSLVGGLKKNAGTSSPTARFSSRREKKKKKKSALTRFESRSGRRHSSFPARKGATLRAEPPAEGEKKGRSTVHPFPEGKKKAGKVGPRFSGGQRKKEFKVSPGGKEKKGER